MELFLNWFLSDRAGLRIRLIYFKAWPPFTVVIDDLQTVFICVIWFSLHRSCVKTMIFCPFPPLMPSFLKKDGLYSYLLTCFLNPPQSYFWPHHALKTTLVAKSNGYKIFSSFVTSWFLKPFPHKGNWQSLDKQLSEDSSERYTRWTWTIL